MAPSETTSGAAGPGRPADYDGRLMAEAARIHDAMAGHPADDSAAVAIARAADGDLEHKVIVRARSLDIAASLADALGTLRTGAAVAAGLAGVLAVSAGVATAHAALTVAAGTPVNFHWALLSLLGVETIALLVWLIVAVANPAGRGTFSLGTLVTAIGRRLARWIHRGPVHTAMVQATGAVMGRGAIARWTVGSLTHGLWLAFLAGALAMTLLTLSIKQVSFAWETTILSEASYVPITETIAALPRAVGFAAPTHDEIVAGRWTGESVPSTASSGAWAGLLVGGVVVYGVIPRAVLFVLCLLVRGRAVRRFRLDLALPAYARLRERLMPSTRDEGIIDGDAEGGSDDVEIVLGAIPILDYDGPVALVGLEIDMPGTGWPPIAPGIKWIDLGIVDSSTDRARVVDALATAAPGLLLIAVSLLTTPDRGVGGDLRALAQAATGPTAVLLSDGRRLRSRHDSSAVAQRIQDWRRLAAGAQVPPEQAIEFDLGQPTEVSRAALFRMLGIGSS